MLFKIIIINLLYLEAFTLFNQKITGLKPTLTSWQMLTIILLILHNFRLAIIKWVKLSDLSCYLYYSQFYSPLDCLYYVQIWTEGGQISFLFPSDSNYNNVGTKHMLTHGRYLIYKTLIEMHACLNIHWSTVRFLVLYRYLCIYILNLFKNIQLLPISPTPVNLFIWGFTLLSTLYRSYHDG